MKLNTLGKKIGFGYVTILVIFLLAMTVTFWQLTKTGKVTERIKELRGPTTESSLTMLNGVNHSLAALRGWILLGKDKFKNERSKAWKDEIEISLTQMDRLSKRWTNSKSIERLKLLRADIVKLKKYQKEIEDIANTEANTPALKLLASEANPQAKIITDSITTIIDIEKKQDASRERKMLLANMADFRGTMGLSLISIKSFVLSGDSKHTDSFKAYWGQNESAYSALKRSRKVFTLKQEKVFKNLINARTIFKELPSKIFKIRLSDEWNMANHWLGSNAAPIAFKIKSTLDEMVKNQGRLMRDDFDLNSTLLKTLKILVVLLLLVGVVAAIFISIRSAKSVTTPISDALKVIQGVASGDYGQKIRISGIKEIKLLGEAISTMQKNLINLTDGLKNEKENLADLTDKLKKEKEKLMEEDWLKGSFASITEKLQGHKDLQGFAMELINNLVPKIDGQIGVFYIKNETSLESNINSHVEEQVSLSLLGSYAYTERQNNLNHLELGEGLVGQCALEKKTISLSNVPDDYIHINSGLGEAKPKNIIVTPILFENNLMGVLEIGSLDSFTESHKLLFEQVASSIGVIMNSIISNNHTEKLLKKSQVMGEELKAQQEELRATNEELEEKANALKTSEEELRAQTEELQASNEELEEKTEHLEKQKYEIEKKKEEVEFTKKQVEEKADELELASKYKSEFLANMSHELRTPLNSLLILAKTLSSNREGNLTDEQVEELEIIHGGGKDLLTLINDILDLSKVEAGKLEAKIENEKISPIMNSLQKLFIPVAKEKGIEFIIEDSCNPGTLQTDRIRTEQILKNFLSNAFKFTENGKVILKSYYSDKSVQLRDQELNSSKTVAFSVTDTGIGIPEDKQKVIFEAFQQQDGSTVRKYGGTGLGLTISRELSNLLGGEIHIESKEGDGSTFTLYLPVKHKGSQKDPKSTKNEDVTPSSLKVVSENKKNTTNGHSNNPSENTTSSFLPDDRKDINSGDKVILIVEDDKNFAKVLSSLAKKKGYKYLIAGDGHSGLNLATEYLPSGIVLDIELPIIDGLTVLDQLKFDLKTRHIPVHMLSAKDESINSLKKGAVGFLNKPAEPEDIDEMFQKIESLGESKIKNILVIEDDKKNQKAINKLIKRDNIKMEFAGSGKEALKKIDSDNFDCIILDLGLPDMTGIELLRSLEKINYHDIAPIVIYTGRDITKEEYKELGRYTDSIVIKGANSPERLLDETSLFLHSIEASLPPDQRKIVQMQHSSDQILKGRRVLVVDDDMRNTYALSKILKEVGLDVTMAENGKMALDLLRKENEIDLVIMDIMMPVMDGFEAMEKIRKMDSFKTLPIITLTAKTMIEDREKCFKAGANDFLTKPVDTDKLLSLIRVWLSGTMNRKYQLKIA